MKLYNILIKKDSAKKIEDVVLIKEGFSWLAFFFSGLWFLYHKMWKEFLVIIAINIAFFFLGKLISDFDKVLFESAFVFVIALNANYWLCEHLKKKHYEAAGLILGHNHVEAKLHFFQGSSLDLSEFSSSILDPKSYRQIAKLQKSS